jgi:prepilin-type N-terminal cleavage/methylation domain-containing protein
MNKKLNTGFTLIELLVVIAIIGILVALVVVAVSNAREKAQDVKIKSNLGQLRRLVEIHFDSNGAYYSGFGGAGGCAEAPSSITCAGGIEDSIATINADMMDIYSVGSPASAYVATSSGDEFCLQASLISNPDSSVCIDNTTSAVQVDRYFCVSGGTVCTFVSL